jgi:S1-C subfamily serine protease
MTSTAHSPDFIQAIAKSLGGVPIWGVLPGSAAHRAGMRYGDIVVRVNGIETPNLTQYLKAQRVNAERVDFEVLRQGVLLKLGVELDVERVWS